jgi:hypothetical protein
MSGRFAVTVATIGVMGLLTAGCGTGSSKAADKIAAVSASREPPQKHILHGTGHLRMAITPTSGPVGTEVNITATGCGDPDGHNHAVSFNPGFGNTLQAAGAHYDGFIRSRLTDQVLNARYRITADDALAAAHADAPPPQFFVQCRDDLADAQFSIAP